jgi:hypothetical protein
MEKEIKEKASNKAFAKLSSLRFELESLKRDYVMGLTGGVTLQELEGVINHVKKEIDIWNYITTLIEKDNT